MSDRQTPESSAAPVSLSRIRGGAARGAEECRADQHAGVDNSVQAAQGCRVASGAEDGADLCTLGTAEPTAPNREIKGIAYGGTWHGEVLTSQLCRGRLMPRRAVKDGKVRMPSGGDYISTPILSEFYDVEIAGYRDEAMPVGTIEGAYYFVLRGAKAPSADQAMADARASGLTVYRGLPTWQP